MLPPRLPHCTRTLHPHGALCPCSRWTILLCCSIRLDSCDVWWWGFVAARRSAPLPSPQVTCRMPGRAEAQGGAERQRERRVEPQEEHGSLDCHALECAACGGCAGFSAALSPRAALALATGRSNDAPTDSRAAQQQARNGEAETRHRKLESKRFLSLRTGGVRRPLCSVPFPLLLVPVDFSEREEAHPATHRLNLSSLLPLPSLRRTAETCIEDHPSMMLLQEHWRWARHVSDALERSTRLLTLMSAAAAVRQLNSHGRETLMDGEGVACNACVD
jgi:hypothetical protein